MKYLHRTWRFLHKLYQYFGLLQVLHRTLVELQEDQGLLIWWLSLIDVIIGVDIVELSSKAVAW